VTDRSASGDGRLEATLAALRGAADLSVQLREKDTAGRQALAWARRCRSLLGDGVPIYVNRRFDIAMASGASGVHLPSDGLPVSRVRANTPRGFRIGISTHSPAEARDAIAQGADLVLIGPIFETPSKRAFGVPLGPEALRDLPPRSEHRAEVLAIGGIDEQNLELLESHADRISGIAAVRLFQDASDPRGVADRVTRRFGPT
jgi:thiamine-phosphate pyrophosphorylase